VITSSNTPTSESTPQGISRSLFDYIGALPSTAGFLPDFMNTETYLTELDLINLSFEAGVDKLALPSTYFGAQLNQLWTHVGYADTLTSLVKLMLTSAATIGDLYNDYILDNPNNPYQFEVTINQFNFLITGIENELIVQVSLGNVSVTMAVLNISGIVTYWVDIFINQDNRLIIYSTPSLLRIIGNIEVTVLDVTSGVSYLLEINKSGDDISGYSYERYGVGSDAIRSHIVFKTNGNYFSVAGEKGDFIPLILSDKVNVETYDRTTGQYLGGEVLEDVVGLDPYETVWYPMWSLQGWNHIRFEPDNNDANAFPQIYVNQSTNEFVVENNNGLFDKSRKYDIELKESYVFQRNNEGNLFKIRFYYPAFFIQEKFITSSNPFGSANTNNNNLFSHSLSSAQQTAIQTQYDTLKVLQKDYKAINVDLYIENLLIALAD
jgi:hypothetical protein